MALYDKLGVVGVCALLAIGASGVYAGALTIATGGSVAAGGNTVQPSCIGENTTIKAVAGQGDFVEGEFVYNQIVVTPVDALGDPVNDGFAACVGVQATMTVVVADGGGAEIATSTPVLIDDPDVLTIDVTPDVPAGGPGSDAFTYNVLVQVPG